MTDRAPIVRPQVLALVLGAGFNAVWALAVLWAAFAAIETAEPRLPWKAVTVARGGVPLLRVYNADNQQVAYEALDGRQPPTERAMLFGATLSVPRPPSITQASWGQRLMVLSVGHPITTYWYLVADRKPADLAYFVGYDGETAQVVGYLGARGLQADEPPPEERFAVDEAAFAQRRVVASLQSYSPPDRSYLERLPQYHALRAGGHGYLLCRDRLVEFDLTARRIRPLGAFPDAFSVSLIERWRPGPRKVEWAVALRTPEQVVLVDPHTDQVQRFTVPAAVHRRTFTFYQTGPQEALIVAEPAVDVPGEGGADVWRIEGDGRILSHDEPRWKRRWWNSGDNRAVIGSIIAGAFPGLIPAIGVLPIVHTPAPSEASWFVAWTRGLLPAWPHLVPLLAMGAALAWVCRRRQCRFAQPWTGAWMAFVLVFGLPGLVGYLVHRRWPPTTACAECHAKVPRDRPACTRCGTPFAPPAPIGTEVFAA